jgi:uncharacterized protein YgfB (UPF0149 family)
VREAISRQGADLDGTIEYYITHDITTESWTPLIGQSVDEDKCFLHHEQQALERSYETEETDPFT